MTENVQKGFLSELLGILKLLTIFALRKINLQHFLYFTAFMTFGVGDGITAANMMEKLGPVSEINPLMSYVFMEQGADGLIAVKIWLTLALLFSAYIVSLKSNGRTFWTVNGFLIALIIGGILAMNANLNAIEGTAPAAPSEIIVIFMALTLFLTEIGSYLDGQTGKSINGNSP